MEGPAARAHRPLSAQPPTAGTVTYTDALSWKHDDVKEGRGRLDGKGMGRLRGEKMKGGVEEEESGGRERLKEKDKEMELQMV